MPYWIWFGNIPPVNTDPTTSVSAQEAATLQGYEAFGRSMIEPVLVDGQILQNNFQTTYNPNAPGGTAMFYDSPALGAVTDTRPSALIAAQFEVWVPDGAGGTMLQGTYGGVIIQMTNGDVFFRPSSSTATAWESVTVLSGIIVTSVTVIASDTTAINPTIGFNPQILDISVVCFLLGTRILTPSGAVAIEEMTPGDKVVTRDHGPQTLRWIGRRHLSATDLAHYPHLHPVRIGAGALGNGLPLRDLLVSPQHRILIRSDIAKRMFDRNEVLVAACHLVGLNGISVAPCPGGLDYLHLAFDRHEIVFAEGAEAESLFTGSEAMRAMGPEDERELRQIFPDLALPARPLVSGRRGRRLVHRHRINRRPLVSAGSPPG